MRANIAWGERKAEFDVSGFDLESCKTHACAVFFNRHPKLRARRFVAAPTFKQMKDMAVAEGMIITLSDVPVVVLPEIEF